MKKLTILSVLVIMSLLLAACGGVGNGSGTGVPGEGTNVGGLGTDVSGAEGTVGVPVTGTEGVGGVATQAGTVESGVATQAGTQAAGGMATATQAAGVTSTQSSGGVSTQGAGGTGTQSAGGMGQGLQDPNINLLSELLDQQVVSNQCDVLGEVNGVLVNRSGDIAYIVVESADDSGLADDTALLPWGALDVNQNLNDFAVSGSSSGTQSTQAAGSAGSGTQANTQSTQTGSSTAQATQASGGSAQSTQGSGSSAAVDCEAYATGALMLNVDSAVLADLPSVNSADDLNSTIGSADWDAELRTFWSGQGVQVADSGEGFSGGSQSGMGSSTQSAGGEGSATQPAGSAGTQPSSSSGQIGSAILISDVDDLNLSNTGQAEIGQIADFVVDPEAGAVTFALLSVGGFLGIGERYVPVPFSATNWSIGEDGMYRVTVDADQARLETAPGFNSLSDFPDVNQQGWDSEFSSYWSSNSQ